MALDKALKTDLSSLAQIIQSKGRGRDTVLAHITPQEAALLKRRGGRGSINPDTGLPEFEDDLGGDMPVYVGGVEQTPEQVAAANPDLYAGGVPTPEDRVQTFGMPKELAGKGMEAINQYYAQPISAATGERFTPAGSTGEYTGDAMGGPASVGPAIAYTGQGREVPIQSAYQLTPEGTDVKPIEQTSSAGDVLKQLKGAVPSMSNEALARLGLVGALGTYGAMQGKQAGTQAEQATAQKSAIAAPYRQQGQELIGAAQRGELTQANQQVIQQQRARLAQASSNMGGVGQQQIENQISSLTSQLLENQYKYGLQVLQIGDNIELGAINTQLQLDQQLNNANRSFYTSLAQLAAGSPMYVPGLTTVTPTRG
jgi:hypothetical protein